MFASGCRFTTIVLIALAFGVASAASDDHDPHNLTKSERATFYPLVCRNATVAESGHHCSALIGYPRAPAVQDLDLTAIAYGSYSAAGARQAYVTYSTMLEPHAHNFGGGILFERSGGWKLVRWYPGGQMDRCVAIPAGGKQRMLCLWSFLQEGEISTELHVVTVASSNDDRARANAVRVLLSVDDPRGGPSFLMPSGNAQCGKPSDSKTSIVQVDAPKRSRQSAFFAESAATYVTGPEWYDACRARGWSKIKGHPTTIRYGLKNGEVMFVSPIAIKSPQP